MLLLTLSSFVGSLLSGNDACAICCFGTDNLSAVEIHPFAPLCQTVPCKSLINSNQHISINKFVFFSSKQIH